MSLWLLFILSVILDSVHYVIMASVHSVCHFGFCPLCHNVFCSPVTMSFTYSIHYVFRSFCLVQRVFYVKYFYKLTNLSRNSKQKIGQYLPFLSRTFIKEFLTIKNTIIYKIKQRRQSSENHKIIYERSTGKEVKERKNHYEKGEFVYIFHSKALFFPYSSHLTS